MNVYEKAVFSQSACNLSGLCHSMATVADEVWAELRKEKGPNCMDTKAFNEHPVMRLFAEQFMFLASGRDYSEASEICEQKAREVA